MLQYSPAPQALSSILYTTQFVVFRLLREWSLIFIHGTTCSVLWPCWVMPSALPGAKFCILFTSLYLYSYLRSRIQCDIVGCGTVLRPAASLGFRPSTMPGAICLIRLLKDVGSPSSSSGIQSNVVLWKSVLGSAIMPWSTSFHLLTGRYVESYFLKWDTLIRRALRLVPNRIRVLFHAKIFLNFLHCLESYLLFDSSLSIWNLFLFWDTPRCVHARTVLRPVALAAVRAFHPIESPSLILFMARYGESSCCCGVHHDFVCSEIVFKSVASTFKIFQPLTSTWPR